MPTDIGYTGQRLDATDLMFYGARYYSPVIGRFISADTIVPQAGNPQDLNRYSYTRDNPLKFIDPNGHVPCDGEYSSTERCTQATAFDKGYALLQDAAIDYCKMHQCERNVLADMGELGVKVVDKALYVLPSTFGVEVSGSVGEDLGIGGDVSPLGFQVVWNWRSGEVAILRTSSADIKAGTPGLVSVNGRAGLIMSWGPSSLDSYMGSTSFGSGSLEADIGPKAGGYLQSSTSVKPIINSNGSVVNVPIVDPNSGMHVTTLGGGLEVGANAVPNGIEGNLNSGLGYSKPVAICRPTGFLQWSCQ